MILEDREDRKNFAEEVCTTVKNAIDEKAASAGHITSSVLENMFERHQQDMSSRMNQILTERLGTAQQSSGQGQVAPNTVQSVPSTRGGYPVNQYHNKLDWGVPLNWSVPTHCTLNNAFMLWHMGTKNESGTHLIWPFSKLKVVPTPQWNKFKIEFIPILKLMDKCPTLILENVMRNDTVSTEYDKALSWVLEQVTYIKEQSKK